MSVSPARGAALRALARVRRDKAFSGPVLGGELRRSGLSSEDAGLATRLTYGTLAAEGVLDEIIDRYAKRALEPRVRDVLRLAAYEMLFGREAAYAVVDQAVQAVRAVRPEASGLANAVARRIAEQADTFPWGDPATDLDALARLSGHPRWIVDLALTDLGPEAGREMLACGMEPAPAYIRLDPFADDRDRVLEDLEVAQPATSPPDPDCILLGRPSAAYSTRTVSEGWFPMDAAAQIAPAACRPAPGMRLLDVGAGRGNKTVCLQGLAMRSGGPARIVAIDIHGAKIAALRERLDRVGVPDVDTRVGDALDLAGAAGGELLDAVLLDAPCSGLGTLRRYPEKRWRLSPDTPERMAELQLKLLESSAAVVGPAGRVVYSTCSVASRENDEVIDAFLGSERGRSFELEPVGNVVPEEWRRFRTARGCFQSWPTSGGPDGHYVAVLRRI